MHDEGRSARRRAAQIRRRPRRALAGLAVASAIGIAVGPAVARPSGHLRAAAPPAARGTRTAVRRGAGPWRPARRQRHDHPIPILMYHVLEAPPRGASYPELYVRASDFAGQMRWLATHGYHAVTLRQAYDYWRLGKRLPTHPVVITFDDGYRSDYTVGLPILRRRGWVGVLNLAVEHEWVDLPPRFIWRLVAAGWELDSHTLTHVDLTGVDAVQLQKEVAGSRAFLRRQYHQPIAFFCYPAGRYDDAVVASVRRAGYLAATTTNYGLASPRQGLLTLDRVRINGSDGVAGFASKLRALAA